MSTDVPEDAENSEPSEENWRDLYEIEKYARETAENQVRILNAQRTYDQEALQRLAAIIESSEDAIIGKTLEGIITSWNPAAERIFGYRADEIIGKPKAILFPPDRLQEEEMILGRLVQGVKTDHIESVRQRKDGTLIDVFVTVSPIRNSVGELIGASTIARDITARKQMEKRLEQRNRELVIAHAEAEQARREAERANRAKSEFLAHMSHEMKTPLNAILGFGQVMERQSLTSPQRNAVKYILSSGQHLLSLVNEIVDFSRVESGHLTLAPEPISVAESVTECWEMLRPLALDRHLRFTYVHAQDPAYILADRRRLKQVLLNLFSNAIKYNVVGGAITVSLERAQPDSVRINVTDTGIGISSADQERLFQPFERLNAASMGVEGTGLGLLLSRWLAEAMGGALTVFSKPGEGSTFSLLLPMATIPPMPPTAAPESDTVTNDQAVERSISILYIEDQRSNAILMEALLEMRPGARLLWEQQGSIGYERAREERPNLILLDMNLPDLSGLDVLARLRSAEQTRDIPVIMVSSDATIQDVERMREAGVVAYLTKPLDVVQFLQTIDTILSSRSSEEEWSFDQEIEMRQ